MSWFERRDRFLKRGRAGQPGEMVSAAWLEDERLSEPSWRHRNAAGQAAGVILGYFGDLVVGSIDDRHIVTVAGSRGGKGVSLIVPNLLFYDGSVVAIDPKGELAAITARARRDKGQNVIVLDPFGASGLSGAISSYNPLDELDIASPDVIDDAAQIADGLITPSENEPHFTDSARILVTALILLTLSLPAVSRVTKQPERRDLRTVWDLLSGTHPEIVDIMGLQKVGPRKALFAIMANLVVESMDSSGQRSFFVR